MNCFLIFLLFTSLREPTYSAKGSLGRDATSSTSLTGGRNSFGCRDSGKGSFREKLQTAMSQGAYGLIANGESTRDTRVRMKESSKSKGIPWTSFTIAC